LIGGAIIHCADLSGATKDFTVAYAWSEKVNQEFSSQVNFYPLLREISKNLS